MSTMPKLARNIGCWQLCGGDHVQLWCKLVDGILDIDSNTLDATIVRFFIVTMVRNTYSSYRRTHA